MAEKLNVVVDLSHHNEMVDFNAVKKAGILGIIHKATQGDSYTDPNYHERQSKALAAGLLWGAYHFGDGNDGEVQAKYFLDVVKPRPEDLLVLDFEQNPNGSSMTLQQAEAFVEYVHEQTGRWPGLYSGSYIKEMPGAKDSVILANCWFWLSQYGSKAVVPKPWETWTMWQYTDGAYGPQPHTVEGVGACDRDKFNGAETALKTLWNCTGA